jgi:hypothetical protein
MEFERVSDLFDRGPAQPLARLREIEADLEEFDRMQAAALARKGVSGLVQRIGWPPRRVPSSAGRRPGCVRGGTGRS